VSALQEGDLSARRLKAYESQWKGVFGKELRIGYGARLLFESMNDTQLDRMMEMFLSPEVQQDTVLSSDFSFDWHGKTILKTVRHQELGPLITSFGAVVAPFFKRLIRSSIF
jgi:flavin-dependent dehydrogenase